MSKLSEQEIEKRLLQFPDWDYFDDAIHAEFEFENFKDCFSAMSRIAFEGEALNHHPDGSNVYNILTFHYQPIAQMVSLILILNWPKLLSPLWRLKNNTYYRIPFLLNLSLK